MRLQRLQYSPISSFPLPVSPRPPLSNLVPQIVLFQRLLLKVSCRCIHSKGLSKSANSFPRRVVRAAGSYRFSVQSLPYSALLGDIMLLQTCPLLRGCLSPAGAGQRGRGLSPGMPWRAPLGRPRSWMLREMPVPPARSSRRSVRLENPLWTISSPAPKDSQSRTPAPPADRAPRAFFPPLFGSGRGSLSVPEGGERSAGAELALAPRGGPGASPGWRTSNTSPGLQHPCQDVIVFCWLQPGFIYVFIYSLPA